MSDLGKEWMKRHGIRPPDLAPYMGGASGPARYMRAVRFFNGDTRRPAERIAAALECASTKLGRRVTYEEMFLGFESTTGRSTGDD